MDLAAHPPGATKTRVNATTVDGQQVERQHREIGFYAPDETTPSRCSAYTAGRGVDAESTCAIVLHMEESAFACIVMPKGPL